MEVRIPQQGVLIADGLLDDDDLAVLVGSAREFVTQRVGAGVARDGLPERRQHAFVDDDEMASRLWARLVAVLPPLPEWFPSEALTSLDPPVARWAATAINRRIRYYRYNMGDRFAPHYDEPFRPVPGQRTFLTVLVYLPAGEDCIGGETVVNGEVIPVVVGRVAVFDHRLIHEGRPVERGTKLVVRTDVIGEAASR